MRSMTCNWQFGESSLVKLVDASRFHRVDLLGIAKVATDLSKSGPRTIA